MTTRNDVTGDLLQSKLNNDNYRDNYDRIFGKKKAKQDTSNTTDASGREPEAKESEQGSCKET